MVLSGHLTGIDRPPMFVPTSRQHFDDEQADLLLRNNLCLCYAYPVVCIDILAPSFPHIWVFNCMCYSPSSAAMRCLWSLLTYFSVGYVYAIGPKDVSIISGRRIDTLPFLNHYQTCFGPIIWGNCHDGGPSNIQCSTYKVCFFCCSPLISFQCQLGSSRLRSSRGWQSNSSPGPLTSDKRSPVGDPFY